MESVPPINRILLHGHWDNDISMLLGSKIPIWNEHIKVVNPGFRRIYKLCCWISLDYPLPKKMVHYNETPPYSFYINIYFRKVGIHVFLIIFSISKYALNLFQLGPNGL